MLYRLLIIIKVPILLTLAGTGSITNTFSRLTFSSYKTTGGFGGELRPDFMQFLIDRCNVTTFIETGTLGAGTTLNAAPLFASIHTIELDQRLYNLSRERLAPYKHVSCYHGESGDVLRTILPAINGKPLFWLDAHYCGEGSAWGKNETPILEELDAIAASNIRDCVILIDDIRGFGTTKKGTVYRCWSNYPTVQELKEKLLQINPLFAVVLIGDILLAYDKTSSEIELSAAAQACTISRMEELPEEEIVRCLQQLSCAEDIERIFIKSLVENQRHYPQNDEYHFLLWSNHL